MFDSLPDTTRRHEVRLTRPLTDADREWVRELAHQAATSCQCKDVKEVRAGTGDWTRWFTWLEHCPRHSLTLPRRGA